MALTKVTGHVVLPTTNIEFHNTKSTGIVTFTHTSNATSATTGALQITGGVGIVKDLHVGGNITVGGTLTYDDVTNIDSLGIITARGGIHVGPPNAGVATVSSNGSASFTGILTTSSTLFAKDFSTSGIGTFADIHVKSNADDTRITSIAPGALILSRTTPVIYLKNNLSDSFDASIELQSNEIRFRGGGNNATGIRMETTSSGVSFPQNIDVDGHTELDNTSIVGVATVTGNFNVVNGTILQTKTGANANYTISRNESVGTTDTALGVIDFASNTAHTVQARLMAKSRGTGNVGGDLIVETRAEGGSLDERLRITGSGKISLGSATTPSPAAWLHVKGNTYQTLRLENYDGGANGPYIELYNNSTSPADDDYTGIISFKNKNSAAEEITYSQIRSQSIDVTDATEDGVLTFHTRSNGTFAEKLRVGTKTVSIGNNPTTHSDYILHVEDSGETNIKVEGSTSTLGARISLQNNDTTANAYSQYAFNDAGGQSTSAIRGINTDQTNNYGELAFLTRNAQGTPPEERMRISKDGNVSINTQNVTQGVLQVNGDVTAGYHHGSGMYGMLAKRKFQGGNALGGYAIRYASGYESPWIVGYNAGSSYDNQITFGSMTTADRSLATGVTKRMVIDMESGMVGIRENDPQKFLHVTGTTSSGAAHFGVFGTNAGNAYIGDTPVVTISTDGNANAGTNDDKAIFQVGRGGGGAGAAAVTKEHLRVTLGGTVQIGGAVGSNSDIDIANTKLTIKQNANNREDGIYIERSGERRGWLQFVGGAGGVSDGFCLSTNQLGTKTDVLSFDRDGRMYFINPSSVGAWFGALSSPSGDVATINTVSTSGKEASIGFSRSNSLGGVTTGWRQTIDSSGHLQTVEHNTARIPLSIRSRMVRTQYGIDTQQNGDNIYTPGTTGFHGSQWITCGCLFPFFYLGERVSSSTTNYSADVLDVYASGHWNGYPKAVIIAHERYYKSGFAVWTFGPYINGSYDLEQVEGWGGFSGTHGNDRNGTVTITDQGNANTHSGQPIRRYTVTIANSGIYSYTRWYIGFIHTGRGVYMSDTSVSDVTTTTSSGACVHMRDISQSQAAHFSYKS